MMSNGSYDKVSTKDTTTDTATGNTSINRRFSFCRKHFKCIGIASVIVFVIIGIIVYIVIENPQRKVSPPSSLTDTNTTAANKCIHNTPEYFVTKLKKDPFMGLCEIGSEFVNKYCIIGKDESSSHACEKCTDGSILPSFCFCDLKVHCVKDKELLGSRAADDSKKTCNWCETIFHNQFKDRGNASCSRTLQALVNSTCKEGYVGFMCSVITTRVCTLEVGQHNLLECNTSNLEECFLKLTLPGKYYHCQPLTDSNIKERSHMEACTLNATP